jgi:hypothetical protein
MSFTVRFDNGDIEIGNAGEQTLITNAEKAAQDLLDEILLPYDASRDRGNEMFNPDGSLTNIVGNPQIGAATMRTMLRSAVTRLQRAQSADASVSRGEVIQRLKTLAVQALNNDPTSYGFFLAIETDGTAVAISRAIRTGHLGDTSKPLLGGFDP